MATQGSDGSKVLIFGLDGLSWDAYRSLRGHGYLHSLAYLESRGVSGSIDMVPPLTPPMWTSITSGVNPGKHGIYSFNLIDGNGKVVRLHRATDVMHPRIHDIVSYNGFESFVANLPLSSWPLIPFRGALVSDWLAPKPFAKPEPLNEIYQGVLRSVEEEYDEPQCKLVKHDIALARTLLRLKDTASLEPLLSRAKYAFIMFGFVDTLLHRYPEEAYHPRTPCVRELASMIDELLKEYLLTVFDEESTVIVVSDHGNDKTDYLVSIPRILYDQGLVKVRMVPVKESMIEKKTEAKTPLAAKIINLLMRNPLTGRIVTNIGRRLVRRLDSLRNVALHVERPVVDEENSPVVIPREWSFGIYINEAVAGKDKEAYIEKTINALLRFQEESGHRFLHSVVRGRGHYFHGPYSGRAPHIVVSPNKGYSFASTNIYAAPIDRSPGVGSHHPANLHIIRPPAGRPVLEEAAKNIKEPWDYAIFALLAMNIPLPNDHDSKLCGKTGIDCRVANYNVKYRLARRLAEKRAR